jgi:hypothetical protein
MCGIFQVYFEWLRHRYQREERRGKMRRTLREWEKLWRERWDINDYADLDHVFAGTEDYKDVICEVEIIIETQEGRVETVETSSFVTSHSWAVQTGKPPCQSPGRFLHS